MALIVMVTGDRLTVSGSAEQVVDALRQARRQEFCALASPIGTVHVNPEHVAYVRDEDPAGEA